MGRIQRLAISVVPVSGVFFWLNLVDLNLRPNSYVGKRLAVRLGATGAP